MPRLTVIRKDRLRVEGEVRTLKQLPPNGFTLNLTLSDGQKQQLRDEDISAIWVECENPTIQSGIVRQAIKAGLRQQGESPCYYFPLTPEINVIFRNMKQIPTAGNA